MNGYTCSECGWPIIVSFPPLLTPKKFQSWCYCANKTCKHHEGDGIEHDILKRDMPVWISKNNKIAEIKEDLTVLTGSAEIAQAIIEKNSINRIEEIKEALALGEKYQKFI